MDYIREIEILDRRIHQYMFRSTFRVFKDGGFHPSQFPILLMLNDADGATQTEIAEKFDRSAATVGVSLKRMESAGLVERRPDENDLRSTRVSLTAEGKMCAARAKSSEDEYNKTKYSNLTEDEKRTLFELLSKMYKNLKDRYDEVKD